MKYKYEFTHIKANDSRFHYVEVDLPLQTTERDTLDNILQFFPHTHSYTKKWVQKFISFEAHRYDKKLLKIAANAYDGLGNTMLGLACDYGRVEAVQKLIDLGANLNTSDKNQKKLALHFASCNMQTYDKNESYEAVAVVKCLLKNGAVTHLKPYENINSYDYAISRRLIAAADLIRARDRDYTVHTIFHLFNELLPLEICSLMSASLDLQTSVELSFSNKKTYTSMAAYKPNKAIFARFFNTPADQQLEKSERLEDEVSTAQNGI